MKRHVTAVGWLAAALAERYDRERPEYRLVELEIPEAEAIPDAVRHFDDAGVQARSFKTSDTLRLYGMADTTARRAGADFLAALACHEQALVFTSIDATIKGLMDAKALIEKSIRTTTEELMAKAAKKAVARAELGPREQLHQQILDNLEQCNLLHKSRLMKVRRDVIDNIIGDQEFSRGEYYANSAVAEAIENFGETHFWTGIMKLRLAIALSRLGKHDEGFTQAEASIVILTEWVDDDRRNTNDPLAMELREAICLRRAELNPLP